MIGRTISHYRIIEKLGEGGMGVVYIAEDTTLARQVAIKFLASPGPNYRNRFLREARAVSVLSHPNIATVYDYGETEDGQPYIVMELVKGKPLSEMLDHGPLPLAQAVRIVSSIAEALGEAHQHGIVHRDVKPSNVVIGEREKLKVLDFGLAKQLTDHVPSVGTPEAPTLLSNQTQSNVVVGTPLYLSPEQALGRPVDGRSDLFALGTLLYECVTGKSAFSGSSVIEIGASVIHVNPSPPSQIDPQIPEELDRITMKALEKQPEARYQSADELLKDLHAVLRALSKDGTRTQSVLPRSSRAQSSALNTLSHSLRRPRLSLRSIIIAVVLGVSVVSGLVVLLRPSPHKPSAAAQQWFNRGTDALRQGSHYQASKFLEQAVAADPEFGLARSRLAEAWVELDYMDKAKDELLKVDRTTLTESGALYLDAVTATATYDHKKAVSLYSQISGQGPEAEKPFTLVDLGRAYERANNAEKAIEVYTEATNRDPQYPVPYLRLGYLYGRKNDLISAHAVFDKAEKLFDSLGSLEGRGEVLFERGFLLNNLRRAAQARDKLQQALEIAGASRNEFLQVRTLLQLSGVFDDLGNPEKAKEHARAGIDLARSTGMDNLTARGLIDLGNVHLYGGDYAEAEKYFGQSLELAERYKSRRNEARARFSLGSVLERQGKLDAAIEFLEPALNFYNAGEFRKEALQCSTLLARARRNKGDYEGARALFREQLQVSQESGDQEQIAMAYGGLGTVDSYQEKYPEALKQFDKRYAINKSLGILRNEALSLHSRGEMLFQLGRYAEAEEAINQAFSIEKGIKGGDRRLLAELHLLKARMALTERKFADSKANSQKAIEFSGNSEGLLALAHYVLGSAQAFSGQGLRAHQTCAAALEKARRLNNQWLISASMLALAQSMLESGDGKAALDTALGAREFFARSGQKDSEWRALLTASLASLRLNDREKAHDYARESREAFSHVMTNWSAEDVNGYLARPDVRFLQRQLSEIPGVPGQ